MKSQREWIHFWYAQAHIHGIFCIPYYAVLEPCTAADAEVELEGGQKLPCRFAVLADGVHSKTAAPLHKAKLEYMYSAAWRQAPSCTYDMT